MWELFITFIFPILLVLLGSVLGIGLTIGWELVRDRRQFKKELEDNSFIDVTSDDWYAAWQTSVENKLVLCTEQVGMQQHGKTVRIWNKERAPENPKAGYFWEGQLQFVQGRHLIGWYFPLKSENNSSRGTIFLFYNGARKVFYGKWVGATYDGDLSTGLVVISKDRNYALEELTQLVGSHHEEVNVFSTFERIHAEFDVREIEHTAPRLLESKESLENFRAQVEEPLQKARRSRKRKGSTDSN